MTTTTRLKPQAIIVLKHLESRAPLTSLVALRVHGIARLASRIDELRSAGYPIETERTIEKTRAGKSRVASYKLIESPDPRA